MSDPNTEQFPSASPEGRAVARFAGRVVRKMDAQLPGVQFLMQDAKRIVTEEWFRTVTLSRTDTDVS